MTVDLRWLDDEFVRKLPTPKPEDVPTLFEMMRESTRENTVSNVLAYFLDETRAHGLGRLFLDSLLYCMKEKSADFPSDFLSPYTVEREPHQIDILIRATDGTWAIVLENKVSHHLNNPLEEYLKKVNATTKAGVVVTLKSLTGWELEYMKKTPDFVNITHTEWLDKVQQQKEAQHAWPADDEGRNKLLYNDFVKTMANNTSALANDPLKNQRIKLFQDHKKNISLLLAQYKELQKYIQDHIEATFTGYGFLKSNAHYYPDLEREETPPLQQVRFFVDDKILTESRISIYFELYGKSCISVDPELRTKINCVADASKLEIGVSKSGKVQDQFRYYHLAFFQNESLLATDNFTSELQELIGRFFAENETLGMSLVDYCRLFTSPTAIRTNE